MGKGRVWGIYALTFFRSPLCLTVGDLGTRLATLLLFGEAWCPDSGRTVQILLSLTAGHCFMFAFLGERVVTISV